MVAVMKAPNSYTKEDDEEFQRVVDAIDALEDEDFDGIVDGGIEVINRVAALLITPPWIYIAVFTLICVVVVIVKFKFM